MMVRNPQDGWCIEGDMASYPLAWCVYIIRFVATHKVYIGSTTRWPIRAQAHINALEADRHANRYLQRAFWSYGDQGLSIEIVELVEPSLGQDHLLKREEHWIGVFKTTQRRNGFNIAAKPSRGTLGVKRTKAQVKRLRKHVVRYLRSPKAVEDRKRAVANGFGGPKTYTLYDGDGQRVEITNLKVFCEERGLDYGRMGAVVAGRAIQYEGWKTHPDRKDEIKTPYRFLSPDGEILEGVGLRAFCLERGLPISGMYHLRSGRTKECRGWRLPDRPASYYRSRSIKDHVLIAPDGSEVVVTNLNAWCKANTPPGRTYRSFHASLMSGSVSNGWRLKPRS